MNQTDHSPHSITNPNKSNQDSVVKEEPKSVIENVFVYNTSEFSTHYYESADEPTDPLQVEADECRIPIYKVISDNVNYENAGDEISKARKDIVVDENNRIVVQAVKEENLVSDEDKITSGQKTDSSGAATPHKESHSLHWVNKQMADVSNKQIKVECDFSEESNSKEFIERREYIDIKEENRDIDENEHKVIIKSEIEILDDHSMSNCDDVSEVEGLDAHEKIEGRILFRKKL